MASDLYTKFILTVVAACLALLVAQGFDPGAPAVAEPASPSAASEGERYRFVPVPMAGILLRLDQHTGETWSMPLRGERAWTPIGEGAEPADAEAFDESAEGADSAEDEAPTTPDS